MDFCCEFCPVVLVLLVHLAHLVVNFIFSHFILQPVSALNLVFKYNVQNQAFKGQGQGLRKSSKVQKFKSSIKVKAFKV